MSACLLTAKPNDSAKRLKKSSCKKNSNRKNINSMNKKTLRFHFSYFAVFTEEIGNGSKLQHRVSIKYLNRCNESERSVGQCEHGKLFNSTQPAINSQSGFPRFVVHFVFDDSLSIQSHTKIKVSYISSLKFSS